MVSGHLFVCLFSLKWEIYYEKETFNKQKGGKMEKVKRYRVELPGKEPKIVENVNYEILSERIAAMGGTIVEIKEKA